MPKGLPDPQEMGFYYALAQVGTEMVVPIGIGIALDYYWGWGPWAMIVGVVFGFAGGLMHLFVLLKRQEKADSARRRRGGK